MKIKIYAFVILCFLSVGMFGQTNLNGYKYVIVPKKFDFLKDANQYRMNELAQFLFEKYGFTAIMEGSDYPDDLAINRCLALRSDVMKDAGLFKTKLNVELKDCNDRVVYVSEVGESREKEYEKAYNEAIRGAFMSLESLNYQYDASKNLVSNMQPVAQNNNNQVSQEIQNLKNEIATLKKEKELVVKAEEVTVVEASAPVQKDEPKPVAVKPEKVMPIKQNLDAVLYAQAIDNGFQLVDSTPKVVYKLKNSGLKDVFFVEGKQAIVYKKGNMWVMEYYEGESLKQESLPIKF